MKSRLKSTESGVSDISRILRQRLAALASDLSLTYQPLIQRFLAGLDAVAWEASHHNGFAVVRQLSEERLQQLAGDKPFVLLLNAYEAFAAGMKSKRRWFDSLRFSGKSGLLVAYFSMEFAIHESMPQYSGGLGILAGDHLKSASDLGVPLVGVGLLYRRGYYKQSFDREGGTRVLYERHEFANWPLQDTGKHISLEIGNKQVKAKLWRAAIGPLPLVLLDTDLPENGKLRVLTHHLYGGDTEYRLQQEILLGVGGVLALKTLGYQPTVFHLNEGHAAFCGLQRLADQRLRGRSFPQAVEQVRQSTVFTTHTPVPAGHDRFDPALFKKYFGALAKTMGITVEDLLALGREDTDDPREHFCMTVLALTLCRRCNGVSKLHGETSRQMWTRIFNAQQPESVPIAHVTNGVHTQTWLAEEIRDLYTKYLSPRWDRNVAEDNCWSRVTRIPDRELWTVRNVLRRKLVEFVRERIAHQMMARFESARIIAGLCDALRDDALTIGFARRFATYKRAPLLFRDRKRLMKILHDRKRPVQIIFAGKAHPRDIPGQELAKQIFHWSQSGDFAGRVVLLEEYDMYVGRRLTSGCDVWLNNPLRPQEASGTSGMKPPLHGGINCSVLDGWWPEAYNGRNGWAIGDGRTFKSRAAQDRYDAESLYDLLERQIVPTFYQRSSNGLPRQWIRIMKESMKTICAQFSAHRMVAEYTRDYYLPAHRGDQ